MLITYILISYCIQTNQVNLNCVEVIQILMTHQNQLYYNMHLLWLQGCYGIPATSLVSPPPIVVTRQLSRVPYQFIYVKDVFAGDFFIFYIFCSIFFFFTIALLSLLFRTGVPCGGRRGARPLIGRIAVTLSAASWRGGRQRHQVKRAKQQRPPPRSASSSTPVRRAVRSDRPPTHPPTDRPFRPSSWCRRRPTGRRRQAETSSKPHNAKNRRSSAHSGRLVDSRYHCRRCRNRRRRRRAVVCRSAYELLLYTCN